MDRLNKLFIIIAAVGIPDAIYHAYGEVTSYSAPLTTACQINNFWGCVTVFQSGYTRFPPPPYPGLSLWVYGAIWFPLMLALAVWYAKDKGGINGVAMLPILMVGNLFTLYLWYLELGVIHAVCPVCVSMYCLNYAMTAIAVVIALRQD
jgi:uncharacterized membrane protein